MLRQHTFLRATAALALFFTAGCESTSTLPAHGSAEISREIVVSAGQSGQMTVFLPSSDASDPIALCAAGTQVCPECKAAAVKYFTTGVLDPRCSRSGALRTVSTLLPSSVGHN